MISMRHTVPSRLFLLALGAALAGCAVGPAYERPDPLQAGAALPGAYKEAEGWVPAAPADALERGPW
ncbi:RND transporter, partial [Acinetobacter baumannii]|nr:RND transporter [Acinetobacter baumannii]